MALKLILYAVRRISWCRRVFGRQFGDRPPIFKTDHVVGREVNCQIGGMCERVIWHGCEDVV